MRPRRSLERILNIRLGIVLAIAFATMVTWPWVHVFILHDGKPASVDKRAFYEVVSNASWVVPFAMVAAYLAIVLTLRHILKPLKEISNLAARIKPGAVLSQTPSPPVRSNAVLLTRAGI